MAAQSLIQQEVSLNKVLCWCGLARKMQYYMPEARQPAVGQDVMQLIRKIREEMPFYGTEVMAAELSRMPDCPVNRKLVRRVCRRMDWGFPARDLSCARRGVEHSGTNTMPLGLSGAGSQLCQRPPDANQGSQSHQVWEPEIAYVWCGPLDGLMLPH